MMQRLGSAWVLVTAALLPASAAAQGRVTYCCNDNGKQICSDVLPQECYGKAYREISARGITVRRVDAPMTAEQRAAKEAEAKTAREEEARRLEQDRKNRALLATYSNEQDIDYARDRAIADVQKAIGAAQDKLDELAAQQKKLDAEAEFYKKKPMPPALKSQIRDNQAEMQAQQAVIDGRTKDIEALRARYENEKLRYRELTGKASSAAARGEAPQPTPAGSARPR